MSKEKRINSHAIISQMPITVLYDRGSVQFRFFSMHVIKL
jgi:hypothetical protein